jgi:hypothetical protein
LSIETIYRVRIFYEIADPDKVEDAFFNAFLSHDDEIQSVESFSCCPAAGPYLTVECADLQKARLVEAEMRRIVRKHRGKIIGDQP